jgi:hypothetical protein
LQLQPLQLPKKENYNMPVRYAVASGNWSSLATWNGGTTFPTASDDVFANGFDVTIDQNINVSSISNRASGSAVAGGNYISTNGIYITASRATAGIVSANATAALIITGSHTVYISSSIQGGDVTNGYGVRITNGGTIYVTGSVSSGVAGGGSTGNYGILVTSGSAFILGNLRTNGDTGNTSGACVAIAAGTASIVGDLYTFTNGVPITMLTGIAQVNVTGNLIILGTSTNNMAVNINGNTGVLNFNGNLRGYNNAAITMLSAATINITGSVFAGYTAVGISSAVASTINVIGPIYASNGYPGVSSTSTTATVRVSGPLICSANGTNAVYSPRIQILSGSTPYYTFESNDISKTITLYDQTYPVTLPDASNVRSGSLYGAMNQFSGSMIVPSTSSVRYGVPVDQTTGSATLTPQDILTYAVSSLTGSNTIGARLQNIATVQTTAATIAAFKGK